MDVNIRNKDQNITFLRGRNNFLCYVLDFGFSSFCLYNGPWFQA